MRDLFSRLIREPLIHFLLLGAGLFWLYSEVGDPESEDAQLIVVQPSDLELLRVQWQRRWGRPPLPQEMDALVDGFVREEILNREARALGLEDGDAIVRRRLAQKMEFLFADLSDQVEVTDADMQDWLELNPERFADPETRSFRHIYFSIDRRGEQAAADAAALLEQGLGDGDDPAGLGDPFMYQSILEGQSQDDVARLFGTAFAEDLFETGPGTWQGPVRSGYGVHLVRVDDMTEARTPSLDEVREDVLYEVRAERQKEVDQAFYEGLRQRYRVEIEQAAESDDTAGQSG